MKQKLFFLTSLIVPMCSLSAQEMAEPYASIQDLPFDGSGWFVNAGAFDYLLTKRECKTIIEVGSWLGLSTRYLASHQPPDGKVYAVDTWRGSQNEEHHLKDPRIKYLYQLFLSNVKHEALTNKIVPIRMESLEAAKALTIRADMIYIDADHSEEAVYNDILAWYPHLKNGGIMCGDDWNVGDSINRAVIRASKVLKREIGVIGALWYFIP